MLHKCFHQAIALLVRIAKLPSSSFLLTSLFMSPPRRIYILKFRHPDRIYDRCTFDDLRRTVTRTVSTRADSGTTSPGCKPCDSMSIRRSSTGHIDGTLGLGFRHLSLLSSRSPTSRSDSRLIVQSRQYKPQKKRGL